MGHEGPEHRQLPGRTLVNFKSVIDVGRSLTSSEMAELRPSLDLVCVYRKSSEAVLIVYTPKQERSSDEVIVSVMRPRLEPGPAKRGPAYLRLSGWVLTSFVVEHGLQCVAIGEQTSPAEAKLWESK